VSGSSTCSLNCLLIYLLQATTRFFVCVLLSVDNYCFCFVILLPSFNIYFWFCNAFHFKFSCIWSVLHSQRAKSCRDDNDVNGDDAGDSVDN